jgi:hypothetical protein
VATKDSSSGSDSGKMLHCKFLLIKKDCNQVKHTTWVIICCVYDVENKMLNFFVKLIRKMESENVDKD